MKKYKLTKQTKIEIKSIWGTLLFEYSCVDNTIKKTLENAKSEEAYLWGADLRGADLRGAYLRGAYLREADLRGANLRGADLREADLREAYLREADLRGANLRGADLREANLRGAENVPYKFFDSLNILRFQKGKLRAFKFLDGNQSPIQDNKITYEVGKTITLKNGDKSDLTLCAEGLNVATLEWCLREGNIDSHNFIEVEFYAKDILAIPFNSDGKFRVSKLKVVREIPKKELKTLLNKKLK
jgi:hypothetical protein